MVKRTTNFWPKTATKKQNKAKINKIDSKKIIFMNENSKKWFLTTEVQNHVNSLTPISDQDRISPYCTNKI